jgi:hypothetical protein
MVALAQLPACPVNSFLSMRCGYPRTTKRVCSCIFVRPAVLSAGVSERRLAIVSNELCHMPGRKLISAHVLTNEHSRCCFKIGCVWPWEAGTEVGDLRLVRLKVVASLPLFVQLTQAVFCGLRLGFLPEETVKIALKHAWFGKSHVMVEICRN